MKKITLLFTCIFFALSACAIKFKVDGINYTVISENTVGVNYDITPYTNEVVIPETVSYLSNNYLVSSICDSAFINNSSLTSVSLPTTVTSIGNMAFFGCTSLSNISIPVSVVNIGESAFQNCSSIKTIAITNTNANIGSQAFYYCSGLVSVSIDAKTMGDAAFADCSSLASVTIGNNLMNIGIDAFYNCTSLAGFSVDKTNPFLMDIDGVIFSKDKKTIIVYPNLKGENYIIPDGVDSIANCAFETCPKLKSVYIPNSVTAIGASAFWGDSGITSIDLPPNLRFLNSWLFRNCTGLTSVVIPDSVKGMGRDVFMNCKNLKSVQFSTSLTNIGAYAFKDCSGLTSVSIPPSVTSINIYAFSSCSNLTSLNIPSSVTIIGSNAFLFCSGLSTINVNCETPPVIYSNTFTGVNMSTCTLNVPIGSKTTYMANLKWNKFSNIIEKDMNVSVNELNQQELILNTGIGFMDIKLDKPANITIYSVEGKNIYSASLNVGNNRINITQGLYIVIFNNLRTKILIQ